MDFKQIAREEGFDLAGAAAAGPCDEQGHLARWVADGLHADMAWMERSLPERSNPILLLPGAKTVIALAANYWHLERPLQPGEGLIARYARGRDYHWVMRRRVLRMMRRLREQHPGERFYVSTDSHPVMEKVWAQRAGLGWIGKNGNLITRRYGSWVLLSAIITTLELPPDEPHPEMCGSCEACLHACPTGAIVREGVVDARRCISYHTIENPGAVPADLQPLFGAWIFGCDICQEVCPYNGLSRRTDWPEFEPRPLSAHPRLDELAVLEPNAFHCRFAGQAVRRAGYGGMRRNIAIAAANLGVPLPADPPAREES